jgi:uncharacterized RDD family membrane protein YckC/predicted Ser/Thr protein kinase
VEPLRPGDPRRIGEHQVVARLGAGGMGQVYLGRSPGGRQIAIKTLHAELGGDPAQRARFRRELQAAATVSGVYTAPLLDADVDASTPWIASAYLPGLTLQETVDRLGPLPADSVRALGTALAEAVTEIHRAGIVHRDLKPSNVLLTPDGPRVIDFGIAQVTEATAITRSGTFLGTPSYLAPEQAAGGTTGAAADVFALGGVLAFAATGSPPFGRGMVDQVLFRVLHSSPDLSHVREPDLRELLLRCLDKDPARRPTPADLLARLSCPAYGTQWLPPAVALEITGSVRQPPPPLSRPYATWPSRCLATLIDLVLVLAPMLGVLAVWAVALGVITAFHLAQTRITGGGWALAVGLQLLDLTAIVSIVPLALWLCHREGTTGQTPGKRRLGIALVNDTTGTSIGFGPALLRRIAHLLDALPMGLAGSGRWDAHRQTFADKVTGTAVVRSIRFDRDHSTPPGTAIPPTE